MRVDAALLAIGLILVCAGVLAFLTGPPRMATTVSSFPVPYTHFEMLSPGPYNFTRTFSYGRNETNFSFPGTHTIVLKVSNLPKVNCTYARLNLFVGGEGRFTPVKGAFINVTLSAIINGKTVVLDTVKAPMNVSELTATGTPVTTVITTTVTVSTSEEVTEPGSLGTGYQVGGGGGHLVIKVEGLGFKNKVGVALVSYDPIYLPTNTSKVILRVSSNAQGSFGASLTLNYVCVITEYLNSPQYVPKTYYEDVTVTDRYLDLGNTSTALILMVAGLALMNVGCYLRAASAKTSEEPQPQAGTA